MESKIYIFKYLLIGYILCLMFSCEDSLDFYPTDSVDDNVFWEQENDAILAVNAIYRDLDDFNMVVTLDGITDIGYIRNSYNDWYQLSMGSHDALDSDVISVWTRYYQGIRRCNVLLSNIGNIKDIDEDLFDRIRAEAIVLRSYFYINLTSLWGDVPLTLETLNIDDHISETSKEEIIATIIDDLDMVVDSNWLPLEYDSENIGRITKGAALGLKARLCLRNEKWSEAAKAAKAVMDLDIYSLLPDYGDLFKYAGENSSEIILSRQYAKESNVHYAFDTGPVSIGGISLAEPTRKLFEMYEYNGEKDEDNPYANIDPRWTYTAYYPGSLVSQSLVFNSYPYEENQSSDKVNSQDDATSHGWNIRKYIDYDSDNDSPSQGSIDAILLRYADILLMYAEAKIEMNDIDETVYNAINEIRNRVGMPSITTGKSKDELNKIIKNERCVELAFEGLRIFDLYRWKEGEKKAGLVEGFQYIDEDTGENKIWNLGVTRQFDPDRDYLWPIPQDEIDLNNNITQNPNY
ncbi:RagB/SusD family nutrient uptake outer membrane protein [Maribellus comscasis]|uniref:RagB/SusD family nutrient uptake outer membrane protein n=1 Tax=Maribellus comscasis TaxID=2681766 RepID=A0A6I6K3I6_9BACT|nr:RagB/SusD family nutrient uptake outer membrane protein [Maribellus comscasis]QGY46153.1 RagB/SusD family nutrient uptake outer membrane protein [Maribellus comscasis]